MISFGGRGQTNLVPNPSFEVYVNCPTTNKELAPYPWFYPTNISTCYVNTCSSSNLYGVPNNTLGGGQNYQYARTGNAYSGLGFYSKMLNPNIGGGRNYIEVKLNDSLISGKFYLGTYYICLANNVKLATNNAGILFSKKAVYVDTLIQKFGILNANPQILSYSNPIIRDTQNWTKVSGVFLAQGGEKFITIGNFGNDGHTFVDSVLSSGLNVSVYSIDDVSVIPLDSFNLKADAGRDSTIHIGDSVFIGSLTNGIDSLKWQNQNTGIAIDSIRPGFWVHPLANTCYVLTQTVNGFTSSDTVCITVQPLPLKFISLTLYPSPTERDLIVAKWTTANEINVSHFNILKSIDGMNFKIIGKVKANNKSYNEYVFTYNGQLSTVDGSLYYRVESVDFDGRKQYSETRTLNLKPQTLNSVSIYPNPAKDFVTVECKGAKELLIIDYLGRTVYRSTVYSRPLTVNTKEFNKGIYIVKAIMLNGEVKNEKLIMQ